MSLWSDNKGFWGRCLLVIASIAVVWLSLRLTCGLGSHGYCGDVPARDVYK